jgi:hypothetical protein
VRYFSTRLPHYYLTSGSVSFYTSAHCSACAPRAWRPHMRVRRGGGSVLVVAAAALAPVVRTVCSFSRTYASVHALRLRLQVHEPPLQLLGPRLQLLEHNDGAVEPPCLRRLCACAQLRQPHAPSTQTMQSAAPCPLHLQAGRRALPACQRWHTSIGTFSCDGWVALSSGALLPQGFYLWGTVNRGRVGCIYLVFTSWRCVRGLNTACSCGCTLS